MWAWLYVSSTLPSRPVGYLLTLRYLSTVFDCYNRMPQNKQNMMCVIRLQLDAGRQFSSGTRTQRVHPNCISVHSAREADMRILMLDHKEVTSLPQSEMSDLESFIAAEFSRLGVTPGRTLPEQTTVGGKNATEPYNHADDTLVVLNKSDLVPVDRQLMGADGGESHPAIRDSRTFRAGQPSERAEMQQVLEPDSSQVFPISCVTGQGLNYFLKIFTDKIKAL